MLPFLGSVPTEGSRSCMCRSRGFTSQIASNTELNSFKKQEPASLQCLQSACSEVMFSLFISSFLFHSNRVISSQKLHFVSSSQRHLIPVCVFPVRSVSEFGGTKYTPLLVSLSSIALCSLSHQEGQAAGGPLYFLK